MTRVTADVFRVWYRHAGGWGLVVQAGSLTAAERIADAMRRAADYPVSRDPRRWCVLPAGQEPDPANGAARIAQPSPVPAGRSTAH